MIRMQFILLRVIYLLVLLELAFSWPAAPAVSSGQHLCGRELADTLALVCHGRGFRTAESQGVHHKRSYITHHMKRSVVDECCLQACSYSQLESYCAPGPAKPASLGSLLQSMKGQRGGTGSRQTPVAPPASPTTTTVQPLYGSEVAAGDRRQSSEMLGGGSSRNRGNRPESPYFGNRPFFFVTPARVNPANVAVRKRKH